MKKTIITTILAAALASYCPTLLAGEKVAYLGVATTELPDAMKSQMDLKNGVVVADVAKESPAAESLEKHDLLIEFNDQLLMNPEQLSELLKSSKKGDVVTIKFIRGGKEQTANCVLGEKEEKDQPKGVRAIPGFEIDGINMQVIPGGGGDAFKNLPAGMQDRIDQLMKEAKENGGDVKTNISSNVMSSAVWNENGITYKIVTKDDTTAVTISDGDEVIFEGPANTKEEKALIPKEHRKQIEGFQKKIGGAGVGGILIQGVPMFCEGKVGK